MKLSKNTVRMLEDYVRTTPTIGVSKKSMSHEEAICQFLNKALEPTLEDRLENLENKIRDLDNKVDRIEKDFDYHVYGD